MVQRNLDNSNKELHDLKENYIQVISKLKEREAIISKMKSSGNNSSSWKNIKALFVVTDILLDRDYFDRPCKGATFWFAACVKWYKFAVHKIRYLLFPMSRAENKTSVKWWLSLVSADHKDKLESENQSMLLKFGSQLDQNLKELHRTVLGSVSQQQQQLRTMEEHSHSFLAHKYDVRKDYIPCHFPFCFIHFMTLSGLKLT